MFSEVFDSDLATHLRAPEASLLLGMWQSARGRRNAPDICDFPERSLGYLRPALMILERTGEDDWLYAHYGSQVAQQAGFDMTGKRVSDFTGILAEFFRSLYDRVSRDIVPLVSLHRLGAYGETALWERLILPMRAADGTISLYVINKVREIERDISHLTARAKGRALLIIQFRRDDAGAIIRYVIVGANGQARAILGRRPDQLSGAEVEAVIPELAHPYVRDLFMEVLANNEPICVSIKIACQHSEQHFRCQITPFNDGITLDFEPESIAEAKAATN